MARDMNNTSKDMAFWEKTRIAELDIWNRDNDEALTLTEAIARGDVIRFPTFESFLDDKYPERVRRRARNEAKRQARASFEALPVRERMKFFAVNELAKALRKYADNLEELESALELEMEDEEGMGLF